MLVFSCCLTPYPKLSDLRHKSVISQCVGTLAEYMAGFFAHSHGLDEGLAGVVI